MSAMASEITGVSIVCSTVCSGADQRKHQSSASLAFVRVIHRWPVDSPHKGPVTRKMGQFDDVIMFLCRQYLPMGYIFLTRRWKFLNNVAPGSAIVQTLTTGIPWALLVCTLDPLHSSVRPSVSLSWPLSFYGSCSYFVHWATDFNRSINAIMVSLCSFYKIGLLHLEIL